MAQSTRTYDMQLTTSTRNQREDLHMNSIRAIRPSATALALALVVPAGIAANIALAEPAQARINVHCAGGASSRLGQGLAWSAGIAQVDPIVSRGEPKSMHEHQFFGSLELLTMDRPDLANYEDVAG